MGCKACGFEVGKIYRLSGTCYHCGIPIIASVSYMGLSDMWHKFRVVPKFQCSCGITIRYAEAPCNGNIDVTEEFQEMILRKESHWAGGSAKR